MTQEHPEQPGRVPIEELRGEAELWRGMANDADTPEANATTLRWCANELEELVEQYE